MAINPISSIPSIIPSGGASSIAGVGALTGPGGDFGKVLKNALDSADTQQQKSSQAITDLLEGKSNDVLPVIDEVAKADMSFKLLIGVRNKVIDAYKQTMNMQI